MEYSEIWNILEMEYSEICEYLESGKVSRKKLLYVTKPFLHILDYSINQNMAYCGIWNFLKYVIFLKMEYS